MCPPFIGCVDFGALLAGGFDATVAFLASWFYGLPMWGIIAAVVIVLGVAWRQGGLPGLAGAAFALGFLLGRKPHEPEDTEHVPANSPDAATPGSVDNVFRDMLRQRAARKPVKPGKWPPAEPLG